MTHLTKCNTNSKVRAMSIHQILNIRDYHVAILLIALMSNPCRKNKPLSDTADTGPIWKLTNPSMHLFNLLANCCIFVNTNYCMLQSGRVSDAFPQLAGMDMDNDRRITGLDFFRFNIYFRSVKTSKLGEIMVAVFKSGNSMLGNSLCFDNRWWSAVPSYRVYEEWDRN